MKTNRGSERVSSFAAVIPVYNGGEFIGNAIESVLNQTFSPSQIIVVDDGSTDNTAIIVKTFGEKVTLVRKSHIGVSAARNAGTDYARADYIAYLDADDTWHTDKLRLFNETIQVWGKPLLLISDFRRYDQKSNKWLSSNTELFPWIKFDCCKRNGHIYAYEQHKAFEVIVRGYPIFPSALVVAKKALESAGGWDRQFTRCQDFEIAMRLARKNGLIYLDRILTTVNTHTGHSNEYDWIARQSEWDLKVLKYHLESDCFSGEDRDVIGVFLIKRMIHRGDLSWKFGFRMDTIRWYLRALFHPRGILVAVKWVVSRFGRLGLENNKQLD